ncbi:MAG: ABC transporter ATP-binding protein [Proteobacteria bacterium]|nr:ABC transporter ATP-binding protein [Pseudomonadota bacterium]
MIRFKPLLLPIAILFSVWICACDPIDDVTTETYTTQTLNFRVFVGPDQSMECNIIANLHRPDSATASHPAPALMGTNGFGGSKDDAYATGTNNELKQFARHGYVGLSYSGLGFGGSDCLISMDSPEYDGLAASQLAQFLGGKTGIAYEEHSYKNGEHVWSKPVASVDYVIRDDNRSGIVNDPRVGMIGASYGGAVLYAAAAVDPRIDTIVPQETWTNLVYSLTPNNADLDEDLLSTAMGVGKISWAESFFLAGLTQPFLHSDVYRPETPCPGFREEACPVINDGINNGYPNDMAFTLNPEVSPLFYADKITIPVFINQGINDSLFNLNEGIAMYKRLKQRDIPVKMLWMSWGHGGGDCLNPFPPGPPCAGNPVPGELNAEEPIENSYQGQLYLDWFGHWLKDEPVSIGEEFSYYRHWIPESTQGPNSNQYAHAPGYPVGTDTMLYLSGSGDLVNTAEDMTPGIAKLKTSKYSATSYSELSAIDRNGKVYDLRGTYMAFTSQPLSTDMDVVGTPVLSVQLQSTEFQVSQISGPSGQLILFAKLYDVGPDGTKELPNRLVAPVRIPDVTQRVSISLPTMAYRFKQGHSLSLVLAQGDLSYAWNRIVGEVEIVNGTGQANTLTLPVVSE